ncbi:MAG TPA: hypothetical protein VF824_09300 [Thermoanaerobaculia bacterium]|jgi:hypothetical protein
MDTCGLLLSFPVAAFFSAAYSLLLIYRLRRSRRRARLLMIGSAIVLALATTECCLLAAKGIVRAYGEMPRSFYVLHTAVFFLTAPAIANVVVLRISPYRPNWFVVAFITFSVAVGLILWNIHIAETLFGPDGIGGAYGRAD